MVLHLFADDDTCVWVQLLYARAKRKYVACGGQRRKNEIHVILVLGQMQTSRGDIAGHQREIRSELALNVEVPLQDIPPLGIGFNIRVLKGFGIPGEGWIRVGGKRAIQRSIDAVYRTLLEEWRGGGVPQEELVRQGRHIVHAKTAPDGRLATLKRIPGKPDTRLEVQTGKIREIGWAEPRLRGGDRDHVRNLVMHLRRNGR